MNPKNSVSRAERKVPGLARTSDPPLYTHTNVLGISDNVGLLWVFERD